MIVFTCRWLNHSLMLLRFDRCDSEILRMQKNSTTGCIVPMAMFSLIPTLCLMSWSKPLLKVEDVERDCSEFMKKANYSWTLGTLHGNQIRPLTKKLIVKTFICLSTNVCFGQVCRISSDLVFNSMFNERIALLWISICILKTNEHLNANQFILAKN